MLSHALSVLGSVIVSSGGTVVGVVVTVVMCGMRIMAVTVAVVRGGDSHLEVVPRHVCEDSVLDVATQVPFLGQGIPILLRVHSPPIITTITFTILFFIHLT